MNKTFKLSILASLLLILSGCGSKLALDREHFTVTPQVLEAVGGKVDATIDGVFPEKMFPAKGVVTITPVLKYEGGETEGTPMSFQGEKAVGNNKVIPTATGGNFSMKSSYDYKPEMKRSELFVRINVVVGSKASDLPEIKLADGVVSTENLVNAQKAKPSPSVDKFQRIISEVTEAQILFLIQQSNVRSSELRNEEIKALVSAISSAAQTENKEIAGIKVSSYASPDGTVKLNESLASNREKNTVNYLNRELKKAKAEGGIEAEFTAEDWDGFKKLLEASNVQDKALILRVLSMYSDPEQREAEIKKLSSAYKVLADDILPQLRRSRMALTIDVIGKSDEEIKALFSSNPSELSLEEMLYAATLYNTPAEKEKVYLKATQLYSNDSRAFNNVGMIKFEAGDVATAKTWFEKAYTIEKSKEASLNLALCAIAEGADNATIEAYLNQAAGAENYEEALGMLYIKKGDYANAVKAFGNLKSNNAALAQILAKDYSKAKTTLAGVKAPDAETYYLQALVGARTNNRAEVLDGLKKSIAEDSAMAKKAANDVEFAKYLVDGEIATLLN
ncbi:MAG: hypothetical protein WCS66_01475 [Bacteroidales bacterium]